MMTATWGMCFPIAPRIAQGGGGLRYRINSASLRFVHRDDMEAQVYGEYLNRLKGV